ncbi:nitroreductase family protein [Chloroflexota bacterium]
MQFDEFLELVKKRRSIRRFKPDPVPDEYVEKMIEAARWSPSGANGQPWEFIIVKDQETKNKMAELWLPHRWEQYFIDHTRVEGVKTVGGLANPPKDLPAFKDAPVLIVVCGDRRTYQATVLSTHFMIGEGGTGGGYLKNMGNATYTLHLAAAALGLASQWFSVLEVWGEELKTLLGVPPMLQIHTVVPVGYPAYEPAPSYRRSFEEIVHHERYDMSKYRSGDQVIEFIRELRKRTKPSFDQGYRTPGKEQS